MEKDMDLQIKNMLSRCDDIEVPDKVSRGIDATLAQIERAGRKKSWKKKGLMAATIMILAIIGLSTAFPALADEIPLINKFLGKDSLFNSYNSSFNSEFKNMKGLQDYSIGIEHTVESKGITVKLNELAYDGAAIYIAYEVNGNGAAEKFYSDVNQKGNFINGNLMINGNKIGEPGAFIPEKIDKDTILYKEVYPLSERDKLPDKMQLSYEIADKQDKSRKWEFNFNISRSQLSHDINKKILNKGVMLGKDKAEILSLVQSPVYASLTVEFDNYKADSYCFALYDDKNNQLQQVDLGRMINNGKKTDVTFFYSLIGNDRVSRIEIVQPKTGYFSSEKIKDKVYMKTNEALPKAISIGSDISLNITKIDDMQTTTEITLTADGIDMQDYVFHGGINTYNSRWSEKDHKAYSTAKVEALGNNTYKITIDKNRDYSGSGNVILTFGRYDEVIGGRLLNIQFKK